MENIEVVQGNLIVERKQSTNNVRRFGWKIKGKIGEFKMIRKENLFLDQRYQRSKRSRSKILKIAQNFDWVCFNTIAVAERNEGDFFVIDGGHRKMAADAREDIQELPCMVHRIEDIPAEAGHFVRINSVRSALKSVEKFRAEVFSGDPVSIEVEKLITNSGLRIGTDSIEGAVGCVALIRRLFQKNPEIFKDVWRIALVVCERNIHEKILSGLFYLSASKGIDLEKYREKLLSAGRAVILGKINSAGIKLGLSSSSEKVAAYGIAEILNYKKKGKRIKIFGPE